MDTNIIREFVVLARLERFTEAANELYLTASTLSKHIASLEKQLGVPLFERTTRSVKLTPYGQMFLGHAVIITRSEDNALDSLKRMLEGENKTIRAMVGGGVRLMGAADIIADYRGKDDEFGIEQYEMAHSSAINDLLAGKFDLMITHTFGMDSNPELEVINFGFDSYKLAINQSCKLSSKNVVSLTDTQGEYLLMPQINTPRYYAIMDEYNKQNIQPLVSYYGNSTGAMLDFAESGLGAAFISSTHVPLAQSQNLQVIEVDPPINIPIGVVLAKSRRQTQAIRRFIECTMNYRRRHEMNR